MPIITTYPFKKAPLDKKDEIVLSDALSSDPNFKTKTTDLDQLMKYVQFHPLPFLSRIEYIYSFGLHLRQSYDSYF